MSDPDWQSIQAITFDASGTLLEPWPSVGAVYATAAADVGVIGLDTATLNERFATVWNRRNHFDFSPSAWRQVVTDTFTGLTPRATDPVLFEAIWERFARPPAWRIFDDVTPCLVSLIASGRRLAVISNWDRRLLPLLAATNLAGFFEFVLPSIEAPAPKPDSRIFMSAAQRLDLPTERILHVGDSEREDVAGARAAGYAAVRIDRAAPASSAHLVRALTELPARLVRANEQTKAGLFHDPAR